MNAFRILYFPVHYLNISVNDIICIVTIHSVFVLSLMISILINNIDRILPGGKCGLKRFNASAVLLKEWIYE